MSPSPHSPCPTPLSPRESHLLARFFFHRFDLAAFARAENLQPAELLAFALSPAVSAHLRHLSAFAELAFSVRTLHARAAAIETLHSVAQSARDPIEQRRAAAAIIRAAAPGRATSRPAPPQPLDPPAASARPNHQTPPHAPRAAARTGPSARTIPHAPEPRPPSATPHHARLDPAPQPTDEPRGTLPHSSAPATAQPNTAAPDTKPPITPAPDQPATPLHSSSTLPTSHPLPHPPITPLTPSPAAGHSTFPAADHAPSPAAHDTPATENPALDADIPQLTPITTNPPSLDHPPSLPGPAPPPYTPPDRAIGAVG